MTIGERIKNRREELGLTQDELAKKCGYKSRSSINKIELSRELPLKKVSLMADALNTTPGYLMGWEDDGIPTVVKVYKKKDGKKVEASPEEVEKAMEFYRKYQKAIPEIRSAVLALLKEDQPDS